MALARAFDFLHGMGQVCGCLKTLLRSHAARTFRQIQTFLAVDRGFSSHPSIIELKRNSVMALGSPVYQYAREDL